MKDLISRRTIAMLAGIRSFLHPGVSFAGFAFSVAEARYLDTNIY